MNDAATIPYSPGANALTGASKENDFGSLSNAATEGETVSGGFKLETVGI